MFAISLSSCSRYNANFKLDQFKFKLDQFHESPPYFWDQWGWPPTPTSLVTHARDNWWTLDFTNAFVSSGVNSRGELVPSHGASRRRLGDYMDNSVLLETKTLVALIRHYIRDQVRVFSVFHPCEWHTKFGNFPPFSLLLFWKYKWSLVRI
jgi:hypothetical protein